MFGLERAELVLGVLIRLITPYCIVLIYRYVGPHRPGKRRGNRCSVGQLLLIAIFICTRLLLSDFYITMLRYVLAVRLSCVCRYNIALYAESLLMMLNSVQHLCYLGFTVFPVDFQLPPLSTPYWKPGLHIDCSSEVIHGAGAYNRTSNI